MNFLILLLIAHLLGDFVLQPTHWVQSKFKNGLKSSGFWMHIGVHALLLFLIGLLFPEFYMGLLIIVVGHAIVDGLKIEFLRTSQNDTSKIMAFIIDQLLHIFIILVVVSQTSVDFDVNHFIQPHYLIIVLGYLFLTLPSSSIIKVLLSPYTKEIEIPESKETKTTWKDLFIQKEIDTEEQKSLKKGGHYIGIIERILVFTFIIIGQWSAVGFLITAKSVFRFGDLNQGKNRQFTEYVLIGTLLSFGFAIATAIIAQFIIRNM